MGDIMSSLGNLGGNLLQGAQTLGGDVLSGIQDVGTSLGGLFGGGGAVSPGTIGATAAQTAGAAAPSMAAIGTDIGAAAPTAGATAAAFDAAPGIAAGSIPGMGAATVPDFSGAISGALPSPDVLSQVTGQPIMAMGAPINPTAGGTDISLAPGVSAPATGLNSGGNFLQSLLKNPKLLAEGGLLGAELMNANKTPTGEAQLKQLAAQQAGFAKNQGELATAEQQGLLPAGATSMFQGQLNAAEAAIRAKYAQMGMTGSSAEMQDLAAARDQVMGQIFQTGQQMAQTGWANVNQATGYQSQLLDEILRTETEQGTALGQALAAFAGAAAK